MAKKSTPKFVPIYIQEEKANRRRWFVIGTVVLLTVAGMFVFHGISTSDTPVTLTFLPR